jgi:6-phosphogluconolactonase
MLTAAIGCFGAGKHYIMYVGTYTDHGSKGIYAYHYDADTGKLSPVGLAAETENPSFVVADANGTHLYAVNETQKYQGQSSGGVTAFAIERKTGILKRLDEVASRGADPCFISIDRSGKHLLVANYTGGTVAVFPIKPDGSIGEASSVLDDEGTVGPNKERQDKAHAHWIEVSTQNRFAFVSDLGLDRVLIYKFEASKGELSRGGASSADKDFFSAKLAPGTGPRHVAVSADGNSIYVLGELDSTVTVFANDKNETYRSIQKISALPPGFSKPNDAAEIVMHPSGRFLYTSNRGDDSIALFAIDHRSGKLTFVERVPSGGKTPRNFAIDPAGKRLFAANQDSGNIVEFAIDQNSGKLTSNGEVAKVPSAVCVVFVEVD